MKRWLILIVFVMLVGGCQSYTRWLSTEVVGCDPARYDQGVCAPRPAKGGTP